MATYDELFSGLDRGAHDMVAATTGITAERLERYLFTAPYFTTCQAAIVRQQTAETLADLEGRPVAAPRNTTSVPAARRVSGVITIVPSAAEAIPRLESGAIDAVICDEFEAVNLARDHGLRVLPEPAVREQYGFVLALDRAELRLQLDRALRELEADGTIARLQERFGLVRPPGWPVLVP